MQSLAFGPRRKSQLPCRGLILKYALPIAAILVSFFPSAVDAQEAETKSRPVVVQPGAPGQASKKLPSSTRAKLPPISAKDVEFMQGMIMHHAQAVEMTALIGDRTTNEEIRRLGSRISHSQADEMRYMERWLKLRGEPTSMPMSSMEHSHHMPGMDKSKHEMTMPGMLTKEQMDALKAAKGAEFDRLFLKGMIQHHKGALQMVEELFNTAGSGQDSELFNFATEVDTGQRAEIKIMESMLGERP